MKKEAEALVREILTAYNKRPEPNDLSACYAIAQQHLLKLTDEPKVKSPQLVIPPGTYRIEKALIVPIEPEPESDRLPKGWTKRLSPHVQASMDRKSVAK